jgi:hypothetical protein
MLAIEKHKNRELKYKEKADNDYEHYQLEHDIYEDNMEESLIPIPYRSDYFHWIGETTLIHQSFHQGDTIGGPLVASCCWYTIEGLFVWRKLNKIR